jgi:hypothetical protein
LTKPFFVFEFALLGEGIHYKRIAYNMYSIFEDLGGISSFIFGMASLINSFLSSDVANCEMLHLLKLRVPKDKFKTFCYNQISSSPKLYSKSFQAEMKMYQKNLEEIDKFLSI